MSVSAFSPQVRHLVHLRSQGRCEKCAAPAAVGSGAQAHHRLPRGAGGSSNPIKGRASNALWLCQRCHTYVETNVPEVYTEGWKVKHGQFPAQVPVRLATPYGKGLWLLDDAGNYLAA